MFIFKLLFVVLAPLLLVPIEAAAQVKWKVETLPDPKASGSGYVADPDGILTDADREAIDRRLARIESQTGIQVAVVIVSSIGEEVPKTFATQLYNRWGVGPRDSRGLLILTVIDQRRTETETGYGLEAALPDARLARLQEAHLVPRFRAGEFGAGLWDYLTALEPFFYDAEAAAEVEAQAAKRGNWPWLLAGIGLLFILVLIIGPTQSQLNPPEDGSPHYPPATLKRNFLMLNLRFWGPALLLINWVSGSLFFDAFAFWPFITISWLNLAFLLIYVRTQNNSLALSSWADPYHRYQHLKKVNTWLGLQAILFFPLMLPLWLLYRWRLRKLRYEPRVSQQTGRPLRLLSEAEEDAWLNRGKQMEEELHTVDHDVWLDDETGEALVLPYKRLQFTYSSCPSCGYITYRQTRNETLISPTYTSEGQGAKYFECKNCGYENTVYYTIPKRTQSESSLSSNSSWSSSDSHSSWGGGSSGGGGAGSSW